MLHRSLVLSLYLRIPNTEKFCNLRTLKACSLLSVLNWADLHARLSISSLFSNVTFLAPNIFCPLIFIFKALQKSGLLLSSSAKVGWKYLQKPLEVSGRFRKIALKESFLRVVAGKDV